jgi:hypothetical protein
VTELDKVLIKLRQRQKLVNELFEVMKKQEETISHYFPSHANGDKKALLEEAENKITEELENDIAKAYQKDLEKALN